MQHVTKGGWAITGAERKNVITHSHVRISNWYGCRVGKCIGLCQGMECDEGLCAFVCELEKRENNTREREEGERDEINKMEEKMCLSREL